MAEEEGGISDVGIAGLVVGLCVFLCLLAVAAFFFLKYRELKDEKEFEDARNMSLVNNGCLKNRALMVVVVASV